MFVFKPKRKGVAVPWQEKPRASHK